MLPGLYKVAQQWMADVAASRFPELLSSGASFDSWFKSHKVRKHLKASFLTAIVVPNEFATYAHSAARHVLQHDH